jgi:hypothetical protein
MGIFDFFRKIFWEEEPKEIEKQKISFSEIGSWVEKKAGENETREKEVFNLIQEKIIFFSNELNEKVNILKNVDIESKKAEEKIKSIVAEGRKKYLEFTESFINDLNAIQKDNLEKVISSINKIFLDFNKSSNMSYERATILIGKEMGEIKDSLKSLSKELIKVFDESKHIVDSSKAISLIQLKLKQMGVIEKNIKRANELKAALGRQIINKKEEDKRILEEIEKIKKSPEYLEHSEKLNRVKFLEEDLEKDFLNLRQLINFKALGNFYHIFEDKIEIVKSYRDNFQINFQKDNGEGILNLLNTAKLNTEEISDKINQISTKREEITKIEIENEKNKDPVQELHSKLTNTVLEVGNLNNEKAREEKRDKKLEANREEIVNQIKEEFEKIGVSVN